MTSFKKVTLNKTDIKKQQAVRIISTLLLPRGGIKQKKHVKNKQVQKLYSEKEKFKYHPATTSEIPGSVAEIIAPK